MLIICPLCHEGVDLKKLQCQKCKGIIDVDKNMVPDRPVAICPACGAQQKFSRLQCPSCRAPIEVGLALPQRTPAERRRWLNITIIGLAAVAVIVLAVLGLSGGPKPNLKSKDPDERLRAVLKITDQTELKNIAFEDQANWVRLAAIRKLTDKDVLAMIAIKDEDVGIGAAAVETLSDQASLAKVAIEAKDGGKPGAYIRGTAVARLTDRALLARVAFEGKESDARLAAYHKIDDAKALADLYATAEDPATRMRVLILPKVRSACQTIPEKHRDRLCAEVLGVVNWLMDPIVRSDLGDVEAILTQWEPTSASYSTDWQGRAPSVPINGLNEHTVGGEVFTVSVTMSKRHQIVSHCWTTEFPDRVHESQAWEQATICPEDVLDDSLGLLSKSTVQGLLVKAAVKGKHCRDALAKIADQALLAEVALYAEDLAIRCAAVEKLTDRNALALIAAQDSAQSVRNLASQRSGKLQNRSAP